MEKGLLKSRSFLHKANAKQKNNLFKYVFIKRPIELFVEFWNSSK